QNDSYRGQQPKSPTDRALVVSQQGYYISPDGEGKILGLAYKLSGISKTVTASPDEYTDLWERLNPLRYIRYQTNEAREVVEHFENFCRQSFSQDPRALLEALGRSNVRVERQISLAIRFGLFSLTFGNLKDTLDEFHPGPWVGVLGEMNDVVPCPPQVNPRAAQANFLTHFSLFKKLAVRHSAQLSAATSVLSKISSKKYLTM